MLSFSHRFPKHQTGYNLRYNGAEERAEQFTAINMVGSCRNTLHFLLDLLHLLGRNQAKGPLRNTVQTYQRTSKAQVNYQHPDSKLGAIADPRRQEELFGSTGRGHSDLR